LTCASLLERCAIRIKGKKRVNLCVLRSKTNRFLALLCAPSESPANPLISGGCRVSPVRQHSLMSGSFNHC